MQMLNDVAPRRAHSPRPTEKVRIGPVPFAALVTLLLLLFAVFIVRHASIFDEDLVTPPPAGPHPAAVSTPPAAVGPLPSTP